MGNVLKNAHSERLEVCSHHRRKSSERSTRWTADHERGHLQAERANILVKDGCSHMGNATRVELVEGDLRKGECCTINPEERALLGVRRTEGERKH